MALRTCSPSRRSHTKSAPPLLARPIASVAFAFSRPRTRLPRYPPDPVTSTGPVDPPSLRPLELEDPSLPINANFLDLAELVRNRLDEIIASSAYRSSSFS